MDKYAKLVGKEVKIIIKTNYLDNCSLAFIKDYNTIEYFILKDYYINKGIYLRIANNCINNLVLYWNLYFENFNDFKLLSKDKIKYIVI